MADRELAPERLTASEAARRIAAGTLTAEKLVRACLARIESRDGEIQAWEFVAREAALARAAALDKGPNRGPLHGLPVAFKDIIATADMPTGYGSPIHAGKRAAADADCVRRVREQGGINLGKVVTTEFAAYFPNRTHNPHNPRHTPGGSSSGSAAAVADFQVPFAFGTQTAGSIIRPASFCGVVGYKPSYGTFSIEGVHPLARSLDTLGYFARSVEDLALLRRALLGAGSPAAPRRPRIGFCRTAQWNEASPEMQKALEDAAAALKRAGADVAEKPLPEEFDELAAVHDVVMGYGMARDLAALRRDHGAELSELLRRAIDRGANVTDTEFAAAMAKTEKARQMLPKFLDDSGLDVLLVPAAPGEAPEGLGSTGNPVFNRIWTLLHVPAIAFPIGRSSSGLPLGAQVIARCGADDRLIDFAWWMAERVGQAVPVAA